jgi:phosphoserine phosphatase
MATKFTGLILASGIKDGNPSAIILETLSPFSISVLSSELMTVRNRFVFSMLIELSPDHQEAIAADLDEITAAGEIDIAYEFQAFDFAASLLNPPTIRELRIAAEHLTSEDLFAVHAALDTINPLLEMQVTSSLNYSISHWLLRDEDGNFEKREASLRALLHSRNLSFSTRSIGEITKSGISVLLDMDSTFINEEVIDLIARAAGIESEVSAITERAMKGELDFSDSLRERVRLLAGQSISILEQARREVTLTEGAKELVEAVHAAGGRIGIVSGGFHDVIDDLLAPFNLDLIVANHFEIKDGLLTGELSGPIIDREAKAATLASFAQGSKLSVAIGDGANDLAMIKSADIGIAFCAKDILREAADIIIEERDLKLVLPLIAF